MFFSPSTFHLSSFTFRCLTGSFTCLLPFAFLLLLASCGYHTPYVGEGATSPQTIHIPMWENRTNRAGLEFTFLDRIHGWFRKNSTLNVTTMNNADLALTGSITAINILGLSYGQFEQITEVKVQLTVSFSLNSKDKIIWDEPALVFEEAYFIASTSEETSNNLKNALEHIAEDLAEKIYLKTVQIPLQSAPPRTSAGVR